MKKKMGSGCIFRPILNTHSGSMWTPKTWTKNMKNMDRHKLKANDQNARPPSRLSVDLESVEFLTLAR
jgi:hypothetical protein